MTKGVRTARAAVSILALGVLSYVLYTSKRDAPNSMDARPREPVHTNPNRPTLSTAPATWTLKGHVVDEEDEVVPSANVVLGTEPKRRAIADKQGAFVFDGLPHQRISVLVTSDRDLEAETMIQANTPYVVIRLHAPRAWQMTVMDDVKDAPIAGANVWLCDTPAGAVITDARGGATLRALDADGGVAKLCAAADGYGLWQEDVAHKGLTTPVEARLHAGYRVSGRVQDHAGVPIAGASIHIENLRTGRRLDSKDITSDANGAWMMTSLSAGEYDFSAEDESHIRGHSERVRTDGFKPVDDVLITLNDGRAIHGVVINDQNIPVAGAHIEGFRGAGSGGAFKSATAAPDGTFTLRGLTDGTWTVFAGTDNAKGSASVDVKPDIDANVVISLPDTSQTIGGVVRDEAQHAVPGASVSARAAMLVTNTDATAGYGYVTGFSADSDAAGAFKLTGLSKGSYLLWATWPGESSASPTDVPPVASGEQNVLLTLNHGGVVRGQLTFANGATPGDDYAIRVGGRPLVARRLKHEGKGRFEFETFSPGGMDLTFEGVDFLNYDAHVDVEPRGKIDMGRIVVKPGRTVQGRVRLQNGEPVAGADVTARLAMRTVKTDQAGAFRFTGLRRLEELTATHPKLGCAPAVPLAKKTYVELILKPYGSLSGQVTRAGQPMAQWAVTAESTLYDIKMVRTGADGVYGFDALGEGSYTLTATEHPENFVELLREEDVKIVADKETHRDLVVPETLIAVQITLTTRPEGRAMFARLRPAKLSAKTAEARLAHYPYAKIAARESAATIERASPGVYQLCLLPGPCSPTATHCVAISEEASTAVVTKDADAGDDDEDKDTGSTRGESATLNCIDITVANEPPLQSFEMGYR